MTVADVPGASDATPGADAPAPRRGPRLTLALALAAGWVAILCLGRAGGRIAPVLGVYAVGVLALTAAAWPEARERLRARWSELGLGLGAGVVLALAAYPVFGALVERDPGLAPQLARLYTLAGARGAAAIWLLLAAVAEEVLFRGLLYDLLADLGPTRAVGLTALVYGAAQLGTGAWLVGVAAAALGLVWGMLRASTGRVVAPLLAHLVFSTVVLVILPLVRF